MVEFVRSVIDFMENADPRSSGLFLADPISATCILTAYLGFVLKIGPLLMEKRKPFDLKGVIQIYNLLQVVVNGYLVIRGTPIVFSNNWRCAEVSNTYTEKDKLGIFLGYVYYLEKIVDLADTVFFILRKKYNQVTFLHVYHHATMVACSLFVGRFLPGGHTGYMPYVNSFVHTVMYTYYFISLLDDKYRKNIWWKKYITQLQLVQFVICGVIYFQPLITEGCKYNKCICVLIVFQNSLMFYLFSKFYYKAYVKKQK